MAVTSDTKHLEQLRSYWKKHRAFPSMARLCQVVGMSSTASVFDLVTRLKDTPLLERLMAPYPGIAIVLSTSWVLHYGLRKAAKELPTGLRSRVVGSIYDGQPPDFHYLPRGEQVAADVERRRPARWLALDDDPIGWPAWAMPHLLLTDPYEGISLPETTAELRQRLWVLAGASKGGTP